MTHRRRRFRLFGSGKSWLNLKRAKRIIQILIGVAVVEALLVTVTILKSREVKEAKVPRVKGVSISIEKIKKPEPEIKKVALAKPVVFPPVTKPVPKAAKIAIVIDDWGYNADNLNFLEEINEPFTLAVFPDHNYSEKIVQSAISNNKEIMIHLPMQPKSSDAALEPNTISVSMKDQEIISLLDKALQSIPQAKGINNHMGSKATEDRRLMTTIFKYLKGKNLYFLDSWTGRSACRIIAGKTKINFARRDVFLDNVDDQEYIRGQFKQLIEVAKQKGSAIGVGHDRKNTLLVLQEMLPEFKKSRIDLVYVSELVKTY